MAKINDFNKKEICAAVKAVKEILDVEGLDVDVTKLWGERCFCLIDRQNAYHENIGDKRFNSLGGIIANIESYHNDSFYKNYQERVDVGEEIPQEDLVRKVLVFLESDYVSDLIWAIDLKTYEKYKDVKDSAIKFNDAERERYVKDGKFDAVGYLCDKSIALDIAKTQSAYALVEHKGKIYDLYTDGEEIVNDFIFDLKIGHVSDYDFSTGDTYADYVDGQKCMIEDDFYDIGLYDNDGWAFYLSEYELEYIGFGDELKKYKTEEKVNKIDSVLEDAISKANAQGSVDGVLKVDVCFEKQ